MRRWLRSGGVHNLAEAGFQSGNIIATFRPAERAYLMHYSSKIARAEIAADEVPAMIGVDNVKITDHRRRGAL